MCGSAAKAVGRGCLAVGRAAGRGIKALSRRRSQKKLEREAKKEHAPPRAAAFGEGALRKAY